MTDNNKIPWPREGDEVFKPGGDRGTQAHLDWFGVWNNDKIIAKGFKETADIVVERCENRTGLEHPDKFLFPVAYSYRHSLELLLKCRLQDGMELGYIEKAKIKGHDLSILWERVRKLLRTARPDAPVKKLDDAEKYIKDFHEIDPYSQAFRYAKDVKGKKVNLEDAPKRIDLSNLRDTAGRIYTFLESVGLMFDAERDARSEQADQY